jgi:hypothetical protein
MRITREALIKLGRDAAAERVRLNRRIVCIYLTGSLLGEDALLGGTTDIDLVVIHDSQPAVEREVLRLAEDAALDMAHFSQDRFRQPRQMRSDPWLSPFIVNHPLVFHDTQHWFEFTQAAISAQFYQPANAIGRGQAHYAAARRGWNALAGGIENPPQAAWDYLKAMEHAGNALAGLEGAPLTERRFLLEFPQRMLALGRPELSESMLGLLEFQGVDGPAWQAWQPDWQAALQAAGALPDCPPRLHPSRQAYYTRAALALFEQSPAAGVWLALRTWSRAAALLPAGSSPRADWNSAAGRLGLDPAQLPARLAALDAFLDTVEATIDEWGRINGV